MLFKIFHLSLFGLNLTPSESSRVFVWSVKTHDQVNHKISVSGRNSNISQYIQNGV